ncbi:MAG TPA: DNA-directed RNA polymerase subunit H [Candidatus Thermoplasmatota archaeon]|nr:DNA-directed RNA polymerase subunit H [Candidatus Thermoplasmatota archaeon]
MSEEVRFNVLNHVNVPLHEVLADEEVAALLKRYNIVREQLPKIKSTDPAARVINAQAGQVVKIIRRSPTAGTATAYRLVVEAI